METETARSWSFTDGGASSVFFSDDEEESPDLETIDGEYMMIPEANTTFPTEDTP